MKVYLVYAEYYDCELILHGVYSTLEKANQAIATNFKIPTSPDDEYYRYSQGDIYIDTMELDK